MSPSRPSPRLWGLPAAAALLGALSPVVAQAAPTYPNQELVCGFNAAREQQRLASAANFAQPVVQQVKVNGAVAWARVSERARMSTSARS